VARAVAHLVEAVAELRLALQRDRDRHQRADDGQHDGRVGFARIVIARRR
jgi:hypothetical protein